jgi:AcrR family transcriptional regulator
MQKLTYDTNRSVTCQAEGVNPLSRHSSRRQKLTAPAGREKRAGERVFEVAADLFYRESIRSVGVETIVQQAGVSKISLYRNFKSKDDLIVAYLKNRNTEYWRKVDQILATKRGNPRARLLALIDYIGGRATTPGYRGCPFINFAAEFPDASHPGHEFVEENKQEMRRRLIALSKAMGARHPDQLADALFLLVEGAYASSQTLGGRSGPAANLLWATKAIIEHHASR